MSSTAYHGATPWLDDGDLELYHGDVLSILRELPARVVTAMTRAARHRHIMVGYGPMTAALEAPEFQRWFRKQVMREARIELARPEGHSLLRAARLPDSATPAGGSVPESRPGHSEGTKWR